MNGRSIWRNRTSRKRARKICPRFAPYFHVTFRISEGQCSPKDKRQVLKFLGFFWCCERGLNSRPLPYQGSALPLSYRSARRTRSRSRRARLCRIGRLSRQGAMPEIAFQADDWKPESRENRAVAGQRAPAECRSGINSKLAAARQRRYKSHQESCGRRAFRRHGGV